MKNQIEKFKTAKLILGIVTAGIIMLSGSKAIAQEKSDSLHREAQVSFFYPLGSNGLSKSYSHNYSFNMLYGMNNGVNGFELGGIANYNKGNVTGAQMGGVANYTTGDVLGIQLAGIANVNGGSTNGSQISGIANVNDGPTKGAQISGIANVNNGSTQGVQASTINIGNGDVQGFQLGVVNYAKKLKGANLGVINIVGDAEEALPIGLINVVKNGYYEIEATGGKTINANVNFKMGVERLYTIFKMGYSSFKNDPVYSYGIGFGTLVPISEKHQISVDISTNGIVYDDEWNVWDEKNILNKLDVTYRRQMTPKLSLLVGPSLNHYISDVKVGNTYGTLRTVGNIKKDVNGDRLKSMWIGFNAGVAFRL